MTFRERYMLGEAEFDEIFDLTDEWNFSDETCTLREYLGLNAEEEDIWISDSDEALEQYMEMEKQRKILFVDLDGTLLDDNKKITAGNQNAIDEMLKQGHYMVISTGRALVSAKKQAALLNLIGKNCYIICFNGAIVYDTEHDEVLYHTSIPMEYVRALFDFCKDRPVDIQTYTETETIAEIDNPNIQKYCQIQKLSYKIVDDVTKEMKSEPCKMLAINFEDSAAVDQLRIDLGNTWDGKLDFYKSTPHLLEMVPPGTNKGNAVRFLADYMGIPMCNTIAAGDAENDLTMIQAAGVGVVMCNGTDELKKHANYITEQDNNHDGIAEVIEKFILQK